MCYSPWLLPSLPRSPNPSLSLCLGIHRHPVIVVQILSPVFSSSLSTYFVFVFWVSHIPSEFTVMVGRNGLIVNTLWGGVLSSYITKVCVYLVSGDSTRYNTQCFVWSNLNFINFNNFHTKDEYCLIWSFVIVLI